MMYKNFVLIIIISLLALSSGGSRSSHQEAASTSSSSPGNTSSNQPQPRRVSAENMDAGEPALATGTDGTIYVAWVEHRPQREADVWLARLSKTGEPLGQPVRVNPMSGEATSWRGDPPTIATARDGAIYVGWTRRTSEHGHSSDLYLSRSRDGG